ncbi:MAG: ABC transporter ATP-binding protein [Rhizobiaceae bacterium]|nr:ABC transporter ATP-binding protein [Rhizobiaceae bacterium]
MNREPVFEAVGLQKNFGGVAVADNITLALYAGDRVALIGPNGAGKTTFVNLVTGNVAPSAGKVRLAGKDVMAESPAMRVRRGLVRTFQLTRLFQRMTVAEHVALAILQREGRTGRLVGNFRAMPNVLAEMREILATLDLSLVADRLVCELGYGQQRLVEIALALALKPKVLLLDEPTAGVPAGETARLESALDQLPPDLAVLMIEHDIDLVFRFARRVVVLDAGAVIFDGQPGDAAASAQVRRVYLGNFTDARHPA